MTNEPTRPDWATALGVAAVIGILATIALTIGVLAPTGGITEIGLILAGASTVSALIGAAWFYFARR